MGLSEKPKKGYSVAFAMFEVQVKGHMPSRVFWTWRILPWFSEDEGFIHKAKADMWTAVL